ncbi:Oidioi.mRNA.OKI2018_I69.PAR.g11532.t1.cds [Oikopleura dioica]|uniref:Oidioi.mRNA.OKI2018_I69.PAR.g11532.t1.cds n=1 Tax=Oikopleura dioica TaxID=34765 RepID=A0ABN7RW24_OIKDI|nr:Oidioi.mRNA.OKI2018_I69.PAR.g11532.t1.cds [Oikopleura dioica]
MSARKIKSKKKYALIEEDILKSIASKFNYNPDTKYLRFTAPKTGLENTPLVKYPDYNDIETKNGEKLAKAANVKIPIGERYPSSSEEEEDDAEEDSEEETDREEYPPWSEYDEQENSTESEPDYYEAKRYEPKPYTEEEKGSTSKIPTSGERSDNRSESSEHRRRNDNRSTTRKSILKHRDVAKRRGEASKSVRIREPERFSPIPTTTHARRNNRKKRSVVFDTFDGGSKRAKRADYPERAVFHESSSPAAAAAAGAAADTTPRDKSDTKRGGRILAGSPVPPDPDRRARSTNDTIWAEGQPLADCENFWQ